MGVSVGGRGGHGWASDPTPVLPGSEWAGCCPNQGGALDSRSGSSEPPGAGTQLPAWPSRGGLYNDHPLGEQELQEDLSVLCSRGHGISGASLLYLERRKEQNTQGEIPGKRSSFRFLTHDTLRKELPSSQLLPTGRPPPRVLATSSESTRIHPVPARRRAAQGRPPAQERPWVPCRLGCGLLKELLKVLRPARGQRAVQSRLTQRHP